MVFLIFLFQSHFVSMEQPQCQWLEIQKGPFFSGLRTWEAIPDLTAQDQRTGDTPCHITTIPSASRTGQQDCQVCVYDACPNPPDLTHQPSRGPPDQPSLERGRLVAPNNAGPKGGRYGDVRAGHKGGQVHHTPASAVSPYSHQTGPSVWMETADHKLTASWGRSKAAQAYREKQADLIAKGKIREAVQMDIEDIRSKFGNKYDSNIQEMLEAFGDEF